MTDEADSVSRTRRTSMPSWWLRFLAQCTLPAMLAVHCQRGWVSRAKRPPGATAAPDLGLPHPRARVSSSGPSSHRHDGSTPESQPSASQRRPGTRAPSAQSLDSRRRHTNRPSTRWHRDRTALVSDMHVDRAGKSILVRLVAPPRGEPCIRLPIYVNWPACAPMGFSSLRSPPVTLRLLYRRYRLSDGGPLPLPKGAGERRISASLGRDEWLVDFTGNAMLVLRNAGRTLMYSDGMTALHFSAPRREHIEDAKVIAGDAARPIVAVALRRPQHGGWLRGHLLLWDVRQGTVSRLARLRVQNIRRVGLLPDGMKHRYFFRACVEGRRRACERGKRMLRFGPNIPPPRSIRLAVAPSGGVLVAYAFGDLFAYRLAAGNIGLIRRVRHLYYRDRAWFVRRGYVRVSQSGQSIVLGGESGLTRIVHLPSGRRCDHLDRRFATHLPLVGGNTTVLWAGFDFGKGGRERVWLLHDGTLLVLSNSCQEQRRIRWDPSRAGKEPWPSQGTLSFAVTRRFVVQLNAGLRIDVARHRSLLPVGSVGLPWSKELAYVDSRIPWLRAIR